MKFKELLNNRDFLLDTNIELALYKLAEDLGIPKEDILSGSCDLAFTNAKLRIFKHLKKFMEAHT